MISKNESEIDTRSEQFPVIFKEAVQTERAKNPRRFRKKLIQSKELRETVCRHGIKSCIEGNALHITQNPRTSK